MKYLKALSVIPLFAALSFPAMAHHKQHNGHFEQRLDRQEMRIERGVRNGELTREETRKLRKKQRKLERMYDRFSEDGWLSRKEKHILTNKLDKNSQRIRKFKHNEKQRGHYDRRYYPHDRHAWRGYDHSPFDRHLWSFVHDLQHEW